MNEREQKAALNARLADVERKIALIKEMVNDGSLNPAHPGFNPMFGQMLVEAVWLESEIAKL